MKTALYIESTFCAMAGLFAVAVMIHHVNDGNALGVVICAVVAAVDVCWSLGMLCICRRMK